jgi:hypothetical protein
MPDITSLALVILIAGAVALAVHRRSRQRLYRRLASQREALIEGRAPHLATRWDPGALRRELRRSRIVRVEGFLAPADLAALRAECETNRHRAERSYIPKHKKGGTLSYEAIHRHAPTCLAFYRSRALQEWLSAVIGEPLTPTADHDQSSCSVLYYDEAGDHIGWHYDYNFYSGRHFTVLLSLVNRSAAGGLSSGRLMQRRRAGGDIEWDTAENALVLFEGARVLHRASPISAGDLRVMLSMTFCTDPRINPLKEVARRIKDTAYYGLRALID